MRLFLKITAIILVTSVMPGVLTIAAQETSEVSVSPESGTVYREGLEQFNAAHYEEALDRFEEAYRLDQRNINALFARSLALVRLGKHTEAVEILREVLARDEHFEKAHQLLPVALANAGDLEGALAAYDSGIELVGNNTSLVLGKAVLLTKMDRNADAVKVLEQANEREPDRTEILEKLAYAYRETGDLESAFAASQKILAHIPDHALALVIIGDYYRLRGEYPAALDAYRKAENDIEMKAYAEHYIEEINRILEELEIEREFEERMKATSD
jgi:tetratricopeptide (TPR) repeat protein